MSLASSRRGSGRVLLGLVIALILVAVVAISVYRARRQTPTALGPTQKQPTTTPATQNSDAATTKPLARSYTDVIRLSHPTFPTTQPLGIPLPLSDAAHIKLADPLYICPRGDLWVTHPDAEPTAEVLRRAGSEQLHVLPDRPLFVHWSIDDEGNPVASLICPAAQGGQFELVQATGRQLLPTRRAYHWERAVAWDNRIAVPTDTGVGILQLTPTLSESYRDLLAPAPSATAPATDPAPPAQHAAAQFLLDTRGVLAWIPWENGKTGSRGAVRFVDGRWIDLGPETGWPEKLLHLVPLLDGSVLQLIPVGPDEVRLGLAALDRPEANEEQIAQLVEQLSDSEPDRRAAARQQLTRYGPGLWPILEKLRDSQPPEGQFHIRQLLQDRIRPTLGGMTLVEDKLRLIARYPDGGAVFYAPEGVAIPTREGEDPQLINPAWLAIRPGRAVELLDYRLIAQLSPLWSRVIAWRNEWIVIDEARGPCVFLGNQLVPLLRGEERQHYTRFLGMDRRGRWLFAPTRDADQDDAAPAQSRPTTAPALTLIIDPTLPDPTPRLPVWDLAVEGGETGWDQNDWPAMKKKAAYALEAAGWRPLKEKDEKDPARSGPDTFFTKLPAGQATASPTTPDLGPLLLSDPQGRRYHDGRTSLKVVEPDGRQITWSLPPSALGDPSAPIHLIRTADDLLFLFNQPGRALRIRPTPEAREPFVLDATFTHKIPDVDEPTRIWLDPAGRIIIAYDGNHLAILFPAGRIPSAIADLMPAADLKDAVEESEDVD